jgi:MerR family transcriptional regulator, repressor of the yfmOP operon
MSTKPGAVTVGPDAPSPGRRLAEPPLAADTAPRLRIGEAASHAGVSTRTLRYYQELGLLTPAGTTSGGARRYSDADVARVQRIRDLRDLVGFDLTEVGAVLSAEDRLAVIRREWFEEQTPRRRQDLIEECIVINQQLQDAVRSKMGSLLDFLAGLEERAEAYRGRLAELRASQTGR